jgi:Family of unknown function (DUF5330)
MFLLRAAFWLSVVIMFIPADPQSDSPAPRVTVVETLVAARAVVADLSNFCERNADVCVTGNAAFHVFAEKAQNGARILYRYFDQGTDGSAAKDEQGTLTGEDRKPAWRDPAYNNAV